MSTYQPYFDNSFPHLKNPITLLVKKLPIKIAYSQEEAEACFFPLQCFGIRLMTKGKLRRSAFIDFPSLFLAQSAKQYLEAYSRQLFGCAVIVEFAKPLPNQNNLNTEKSGPTSQVITEPASSITMDSLSKRLKRDPLAPDSGLVYYTDPEARYEYPPATSEVVGRMAHALLHVPEFYTQALHIMNQMQLPPPFKPWPSQLPKLDLSLPDENLTANDNKTKRASKVATDESEVEFSEDEKPLVVAPTKRPLLKKRKPNS